MKHSSGTAGYHKIENTLRFFPLLPGLGVNIHKEKGRGKHWQYSIKRVDRNLLFLEQSYAIHWIKKLMWCHPYMSSVAPGPVLELGCVTTPSCPELQRKPCLSMWDVWSWLPLLATWQGGVKGNCDWGVQEVMLKCLSSLTKLLNVWLCSQTH